MTANTPKGLRLHIGIFGRRNVGKSSILNAITRQNVSIVSQIGGTTTDPVEKPMELLPLGPVLFIDTAGVDDTGELGRMRVEKTRLVYERCDLALLVTDGEWGSHEEKIADQLKRHDIPWIAVLNQCDKHDFRLLVKNLREKKIDAVETSIYEPATIETLAQAMIQKAPADFLEARRLIADLIPENGHVLLVIPIDREAPKGRLILPQVQTIRDILDAHASCSICQESEVSRMLALFKMPPALVVTDSQAFENVARQVPESVALTGFSVLFARFKGDLESLAQGAKAIRTLKPGDKVLIAEACTHHPIQDDIGRVKIPNWLKKCVGGDIQIDVVSGCDFPENLEQYHVIIHCGACMWTRRQVLGRIRQAAASGTPMTNYGIAIAALKGILPRALKPFGMEFHA